MGKSSNLAVAAAVVAPPAALPEGALRDEYAGKGGSYIYDPESGKRVPAEQPIEQPVAAEVSNG